MNAHDRHPVVPQVLHDTTWSVRLGHGLKDLDQGSATRDSWAADDAINPDYRAVTGRWSLSGGGG
jgi:hypothetical protein